MILRFLAAAQDRYVTFRYRKYRAPLPRISYVTEDPGIRAYVNAVRYRKYRPYVLALVLVAAAVRRAGNKQQRGAT